MGGRKLFDSIQIASVKGNDTTLSIIFLGKRSVDTDTLLLCRLGYTLLHLHFIPSAPSRFRLLLISAEIAYVRLIL